MLPFVGGFGCLSRRFEHFVFEFDIKLPLKLCHWSQYGISGCLHRKLSFDPILKRYYLYDTEINHMNGAIMKLNCCLGALVIQFSYNLANINVVQLIKLTLMSRKMGVSWAIAMEIAVFDELFGSFLCTIPVDFICSPFFGLFWLESRTLFW